MPLKQHAQVITQSLLTWLNHEHTVSLEVPLTPEAEGSFLIMQIFYMTNTFTTVNGLYLLFVTGDPPQCIYRVGCLCIFLHKNNLGARVVLYILEPFRIFIHSDS